MQAQTKNALIHSNAIAPSTVYCLEIIVPSEEADKKPCCRRRNDFVAESYSNSVQIEALHYKFARRKQSWVLRRTLLCATRTNAVLSSWWIIAEL